MVNMMKSLRTRIVRRIFLAGVCALLCGVAGCGAPGGSVPPQNAASVLRSAARAVLIGRAYDRALWAAERGDIAAFGMAHSELRRLGAASEALTLVQRVALSPAEEAVARALAPELSVAELAEYTSTGRVPASVEQRMARQYRRALQLSPQFDSLDPVKLNALGYFLAEHGTTADDFKTAERLTRAALRLLDEAMTQEEQRGDDALRLLALRAAVRDSVAWALFRQQRLAEALIEQRRAVAEAEAGARKGADAVTAEFYFHLGEIHRALGQLDEARDQYQKALKADPKDNASRRALQAVEPLLKPSPMIKPPPKL